VQYGYFVYSRVFSGYLVLASTFGLAMMAMTFQSPLAVALRNKRILDRITQANAAKTLGVRPATLHNWEYGMSPQLRMYPKIAAYLGVSEESVKDLLAEKTPTETEEKTTQLPPESNTELPPWLEIRLNISRRICSPPVLCRDEITLLMRLLDETDQERTVNDRHE
jgi:transcriptional regulator with XRE-family HTH domain